MKKSEEYLIRARFKLQEMTADDVIKMLSILSDEERAKCIESIFTERLEKCETGTLEDARTMLNKMAKEYPKLYKNRIASKETNIPNLDKYYEDVHKLLKYYSTDKIVIENTAPTDINVVDLLETDLTVPHYKMFILDEIQINDFKKKGLCAVKWIKEVGNIHLADAKGIVDKIKINTVCKKLILTIASNEEHSDVLKSMPEPYIVKRDCYKKMIDFKTKNMDPVEFSVIDIRKW